MAQAFRELGLKVVSNTLHKRRTCFCCNSLAAFTALIDWLLAIKTPLSVDYRLDHGIFTQHGQKWLKLNKIITDEAPLLWALHEKEPTERAWFE